MEKSRIYENFLDVIESKFTSEATLKTYNNIAENFIYDKHPNSLEALTSKYLKRYLLEVKNNKSCSSHNQLLSVIKIIYRDVLKQRYKVESFKPIKIHRKLKALPTMNHINSIIPTITNIKHYTLIMLLLSTGIRMSELLNVRILDIDSEHNRLLIRNGKGGKSRFVGLTDKIINQLRNYYKEYRPRYYLFEYKGHQYSSSSVNKVIKKHFGDNYHAHLFRHIYMTYMINKDVNTHKLQHMVGHNNTKSTMWYYQYSEETLEININPINEII